MRIGITGIGCVAAPGERLDLCMEALFTGQRAPQPPLRYRTSHPTPFPVFECIGFDTPSHLTRTAALGLAAAQAALEDADLLSTHLPRAAGVVMGTTAGCVLMDDPMWRAVRKGERPDRLPITHMLQNNPATIIAQAFALTGPLQTIVNACTSSSDALGVAAGWIQEGRCDVVLAGGADGLCAITSCGFISMKIADEAPCRPFDRDRRGLNLGEGAAVLVMESEASLRRRGILPRAWLLGYGAACDAYHQTAPHPEGTGLRKAAALALAAADLAPSDVAFVNAHGTGTPDNDRVEALVLAQAFPGIPFLSTKGATGHTLGAAGAIEAAFSVACLERGAVPASLGCLTPDPELAACPVTCPTHVAGTAALSFSLAFGGNNAVVALGRGERC